MTRATSGIAVTWQDRSRGAPGDDDAGVGVRSSRALIAWRPWRAASAVTAQVFITTIAEGPALDIAADHVRLMHRAGSRK